MPRTAKPLTAIQIKRGDPPLDKPGLHGVGTVAGLRMRVKAGGCAAAQPR